MSQDSTAGLAAAVSPFVFSANLHLKASLNSNLTFHAHLTPAVGKFARQTLTQTQTNFSRKPFHFVNSFAAGSVAGPQLFWLEYIINNRPGTAKGSTKQGGMNIKFVNTYSILMCVYATGGAKPASCDFVKHIHHRSV